MAIRQPRASRAPLAITLVVGVLLIAGVRFIVGGGLDGIFRANGGPVSTSQGAGPCIPLAVAASSEKAALMTQMAADYMGSTQPVDGRCVAVTVTSKASGAAADALARGWDETVDGPRPDVWTPAASSWLVILQEASTELDHASLVPDNVPSVANTPLVIAMPRPMAEAMGWPDKPIGWSDILSLANDPAGWGKLGHPEWGAFRLGKTNPNISTSGLHATIGAYFAATGLSSGLSTTVIQKPEVRAFVQGVESSVVHYGDTTLTFLSNLQRADDAGRGLSYVSAVAVEEKSVWDYDQGNPTGDPTTLGQHAPPKTPLVAIYPKEGTLISDSPYAVLNASWVDASKRDVAASFLAFLQSPAQQQRFQSFAFRDYQGHPGSLITEANGMLPSEPKATLSPPSPQVMAAIKGSWAELRKRARVILVIDVSGSMGEAVGDAGTNKIELAKSAAIKALDEFSPDDDVGLWVFSTDMDGAHHPYLELFPVAPLGPNLSAMKERIQGLEPLNGTALYASTRAAVAEMRGSFDPDRINAVVLLTDGKNEYPQDTDRDGLVRSLEAESPETAVRVFPIAYGGDADKDTLRMIAEGSQAALYDASDPGSIEKVFLAVVSNF